MVALPASTVETLPERVIDACVDQLEHEGAEITGRAPLTIGFRVPLTMLKRPQQLTSDVDRGTIDIALVAEGRFVLTYQLSLWRLVVFLTVGAPIMFGVLTPGFLGLTSWEFAAVAWFFLVGVTYVIKVVRARAWFRRRIADAIELATTLTSHGASDSRK
jgi:hypothetical protein